jgi:hypothetical protein
MQRDTRVLVAADRSIIEATAAALTLLELQALPPGGLSVENDDTASKAFEAAWIEGGRNPVVGSGTIRLLDGRLIRVQYFIVVQPDGGFEIVLDRADEPVGAPTRDLHGWRGAREMAGSRTDAIAARP